MLKKKKTMKTVIVASAAVAVMLVGAASAYFTSTDEATNTWTVGSVDITLHEDAYDAAQTENITPMQDLTKDPVVENTGDNEAFVFAKVSVPKSNVITAASDGTKNAAAVHQLFTYEVDDNWTLVSSDESGESVNTYVYAYGNSSKCTALAPEASTSSVFKDSKVTFINVIEGQVGESLEIPVTVYGIQTTNLTDSDISDPEGVWAILSKQTPEHVE